MNKIQDLDLLQLFRSEKFAIYISLILLFAQVTHSSHALMDLTTITGFWRPVYGWLSAACCDFLVIFFLTRSSKLASIISLVFISLVNTYAYHMDGLQYFSYKSFFCIMVAFGIPTFLHLVTREFSHEK